jgi:hypothetical protein
MNNDSKILDGVETMSIDWETIKDTVETKKTL